MKYEYDPIKLELRQARNRGLKALFSSFTILGISFGISLGVFLYDYNTRKILNKYEKEGELMIVRVADGEGEFSKEVFMEYLEKSGIMFPEVVYAQAIQESNFESAIWRENHNPFGMKVAGSRPTTALGERRGHAYYLHWKYAVQDMALFQAAFLRKIRTEDEYIQYLEQHYAGKGYGHKIRNVLKQIRK